MPAIIYYELRRELVRLRLPEALRDLDDYVEVLGFAPVTLAVLTRASEMWALARRRGRPSADDRSLDVDAILAATGLGIAARGHDVTVATDNVRHLGQFIRSARWEDITP